MKQNTQTVRLGFTVGDGSPVDIPVRHMAISGQTQEAGKTTALEGLIKRSGLRAVTFITKRGEDSFTGARRVAPHFRERADWQFVASLLEASRGEKMKFERAWIIRASEGAADLAGVRANVARLMAESRGLSADVYLVLRSYLDAILPTVTGVRWADRLELSPGINAVDLSAIPSEMQHLVIQSSIEWVQLHEEKTVVVIPEAWKFLPQGRGTPVKHAAIAFIRQGAALRNYLWLDSQDIGGIEKEVLRSVPVWILGVQREANEITRTLDNIPDGVNKPTRSKMALLELGQFYACWKGHAVKTYAQPAWMKDAAALEIARGADIDEVLKGDCYADVASFADAIDRFTGGRVNLRDDIDEANVHGSRTVVDLLKSSGGRRAPLDLNRNLDTRQPPEDVMNVNQEKKLDTLIGAVGTLVQLMTKSAAKPLNVADVQPASPPPVARAAVELGPPAPVEPFADAGVEAQYQQFRQRLLAEYPSLQIVIERPEVEVIVERRKVVVDGESWRGRIGRLIVEGFWGNPRTSTDVIAEFNKRGWAVNNGAIGMELNKLTADGFFTRTNKWINFNPTMKVWITEREAAE